MPQQPNDNPFEHWAGALPAFQSVEQINEWVREMRDEEHVPVSAHQLKDGQPNLDPQLL